MSTNSNKLTKWEWATACLSFIFFCLLCLGQLQRWQVTPTVAIYAHDVVLLALLGLNATWWLTQVKNWHQQFSLSQHWLVVVLLGWIGVGWLMALLSGEAWLTALLYTGRLMAYLALNWQLLTATWWPKLFPWSQPALRVVSGYWLVGLFVMLMGYLQYWLLPDIRFMGTFGWDVHLYRLVSVQLDPNISGALLAVTLLITLCLPFSRRGPQIPITIALLGSIALTYSRSTYAAVVVGLLSWAFIKRRDRQSGLAAISLIGLLLVMIVNLPRPGGEGVRLERTASGVARVETAQTALSSLSPLEWIVGNGFFVPGSFSQASDVILGQHAQLSDNLIILFLNGLGIVGLVLLTILLYHHRRALGQLSLLAITSTLAILAHSQFNNTLFQPFVWLMLTAIILTSVKYRGEPQTLSGA